MDENIANREMIMTGVFIALTICDSSGRFCAH
jgi:hypothetical protein